MKTDQTAFNAGFDAYQAGKSASSNPYMKGSVKYDSWFEGWSEAYEQQHDI